VRANWFPTPPILSLRPGAAIALWFSDPLNAAKTLLTEPKASTYRSSGTEYDPSLSFLSVEMATPPTITGSTHHFLSEGDLA